jgi:hypothetical protein
VTAIPDGWMGLDNGPESTKAVQVHTDTTSTAYIQYMYNHSTCMCTSGALLLLLTGFCFG